MVESCGAVGIVGFMWVTTGYTLMQGVGVCRSSMTGGDCAGVVFSIMGLCMDGAYWL
jgi:hypothetical protein